MNTPVDPTSTDAWSDLQTLKGASSPTSVAGSRPIPTAPATSPSTWPTCTSTCRRT
ncbi:hypothetical protein G7085_13945 [Tessaracoccus sp. HDW20]|nr:hypothetical protein [Tessaracoccus coleopterorum]